jgi:tetrahydromethanopterin S-methyltransferase subunit E
VHHAEHHTSNRQAWLTALYLATALIALALYRIAHLHVVAALVLGFGISAVLVGLAYAIVARRGRSN